MNSSLDAACNGDPNFQLNCTDQNFNDIGHFIANSGQFGWTVGAGFELGLTRSWSAKAEYDYLDFGSKNFVLEDGTVLNFKQNFKQVKIGLNYRFGQPDEVAVASAMPVKAAPIALFNWTGGYAGAAIADHWSAS